jgi:hypothetical protein
MDSYLKNKLFLTPVKFASLHFGEYLTGQAGLTPLRLVSFGAASRIFYRSPEESGKFQSPTARENLFAIKCFLNRHGNRCSSCRTRSPLKTGSLTGIQVAEFFPLCWIPGQARNDELNNYADKLRNL